MAETLHVEAREKSGKLINRRLRQAGRLPAIIYGEGKKPLAVSLPSDEVGALIRHGAHVVELDGATKGQALLQDVQWDTFSQHVLHVDLMRIAKGARVKVEVPIELRGDAPGKRNGGIVEQFIREVEIEVAAEKVPDKLHININHLELEGQLTIGDIEDLPEGAKILSEVDEMVVHCVMPEVEEAEEGEVAAGVAEPEIIGKKPDEEEGEAEEEK
jgi:large subunit ribosomal protein L25